MLEMQKIDYFRKNFIRASQLNPDKLFSFDRIIQKEENLFIGKNSQIDQLPYYSDEVNSFYSRHKVFWMFPSFFEDQIFNVTFKSYFKSEYITYRLLGNMPVVGWGWHYFKDFKLGSEIVLVEGVKDAVAYRELFQYPYVLALLTSTISEQAFVCLKALTNKFKVAFDNDKGGWIGFKNLMKLESSKGCRFNRHIPDIGEDWNDVFQRRPLY